MTAGRVGFFERPIAVNLDDALLYIDAGDPASYSGTGTVWTDLSGTNNTATLVGPTFNVANGGYFTFDGSNDYVYTTNSHPATLPYNSNFTVISWFKTSVSSGKKIIGLEDTQIFSANAWDRQLYVGLSGLLYWGIFSIGLGPRVVTSLNTVTDNTWRYAVGVYDYDSGEIRLYINAVLQNTQAVPAVAAYSYYIKLGLLRFAGDWPSTVPTGYFPGDIAFGAVYKRAFGLSEIQATFNATRGRFGV